ncbi:MAG: GNAT family N-acetyltransferase [Gammaproteobacteria bacterium]|nr:GNAT family N-acetyltransferase [Gammaproteobacteria bacterium]MCP5424385.1 GNAT family N-acetyltransferase [Gammaproteobacteria bacterium]
MVSTELAQVLSANEYAAARMLFEEYAAALDVDLCFQNFAQELVTLEGYYGPPEGCLLLARDDGQAIGCVALRRRGQGVCEMKRLYVKPEYRGLGIGRLLTGVIIERARALRYQKMVLDTLQNMLAAKALYESLGFREIDSYYDNPLQSVRYLALDLTANAACDG